MKIITHHINQHVIANKIKACNRLSNEDKAKAIADIKEMINNDEYYDSVSMFNMTKDEFMKETYLIDAFVWSRSKLTHGFWSRISRISERIRS